MAASLGLGTFIRSVVARDSVGMRVLIRGTVVVLVFLFALASAGRADASTETWTDSFDDTSRVSFASGVSVGGGHVQLVEPGAVRQGVQLAPGYEVYAPSIVRTSTGYLLYVTASGGSAIQVTTSSDANSWTFPQTVITPGFTGSTDSSLVAYEDTVQVGPTFHMWYSGRPAGDFYTIHHATSSDGLSWAPGGVVLTASMDGLIGDVVAPSVLWDGTQYTMWYEYYDGIHTWIRRATSPDGAAWTPTGAVLSPTTNGIDDEGPRLASVVRVGAEFLMWYTCAGPAICRAHSADGIGWVRDGIWLGPDPRYLGEDQAVAMAEPYPIGPDSFRVWYSARGSVSQIFSAITISGFQTIGSLISVRVELPSGFEWQTLAVEKSEPPGTSITVTILDPRTGLSVSGFAGLSATTVSLSALDSRSLRALILQATLTGDGSTTPILDRWSVTFGTPPPPSWFDLYRPALLVLGLIAGAAGAFGVIAFLATRTRRPSQ